MRGWSLRDNLKNLCLESWGIWVNSYTKCSYACFAGLRLFVPDAVYFRLFFIDLIWNLLLLGTNYNSVFRILWLLYLYNVNVENGTKNMNENLNRSNTLQNVKWYVNVHYCINNENNIRHCVYNSIDVTY